MKINSLSIKHKQYLLAGGIAALGIGIVISLFYSLSTQEAWMSSEGEKQVSQETNIASIGKRISPQELWVERVENDAKTTRQKVENLEKMVKDTHQGSGQQVDELLALKEELDHLKEQLEIAQEVPLHQDDSPKQSTQPEPNFDIPNVAAPGVHTTNAHKIVINLKHGTRKNKSERKTVENTIPAGAYAKAVLIGGVDASTAVNSQGDPRPILLRITDHGNLPRRFKSDLKACHALASAYGDLSSERVYMRLEKLTCTEPLTGEIIETQVAGYVAGEDGRAGMRGVVVDRAGESVRNSFLAGFVGGISNFFGAQQQRSVYPVSPFGQTNSLSVDKMMGAGASQGLNNAMEKLADFYIKRADQLQPVLQVAAGREVDIIFTQGTDIGSTTVKQTIKKVRDQSRQEAISTLESTTDTKTWLPDGESHD
jgi:conjugal transfer pilus assembly protein TraB